MLFYILVAALKHVHKTISSNFWKITFFCHDVPIILTLFIPISQNNYFKRTLSYDHFSLKWLHVYLLTHGWWSELWSATQNNQYIQYISIPRGYINDTCMLTFLPQEYNSIPLHWNNQPQNVNDTNLWLPGFFLWSRLGQSAISWWCTVNRRRQWTETCLRGSQSRSRRQWCWEGTEDDV